MMPHKKNPKIIPNVSPISSFVYETKYMFKNGLKFYQYYYYYYENLSIFYTNDFSFQTWFIKKNKIVTSLYLNIKI